MSDLDTSLRELREDLRGTLTRPDLSRVADRARQQKVRRRMQLSAIVAVVLVSVAVPVLRMVPSDSHPPAQPPADPPASYYVDFADTDHGYAFREDCESVSGPCEFALRATDDGGRTWQHVELPEGREKYAQAWVSVAGPQELFFSRATPAMRGVGEPFVSDDAGRTWRNPGTLPHWAPAVISSGAQVLPMCVSEPTDSRCVVGLGTRAVTGFTPVLTQPPLVDPWPGTTATAGGRYWATGRDQTTGSWAVSVTSDEGATWATTVLNLKGLPAQQVDNVWSVTERGRDMYLTVVGNVAVGPQELLAVFHSTDKGVSWTRTWQSTEKHELQAVTGDAVLTADGQLLVYSRVVGTVSSRDGGRTFTKAEHQFRGPVRWTRAGYLTTGPADNVFEQSDDGLDWRRLEVR